MRSYMAPPEGGPVDGGLDARIEVAHVGGEDGVARGGGGGGVDEDAAAAVLEAEACAVGRVEAEEGVEEAEVDGAGLARA